MAESSAWTLYGIAPPDNTFRDPNESVHRAFWQFIAARGVERFRWRCNAGLDRNGAGLTGIAESTRKKGRWRSHTGQGTADNPPLSPALGRSRTPDLIRGRAFADHAEWFWGFDQVSGRNWGQVMLWHRAGGGHLPQRDVIGWSRDDVAWLRTEGAKWWYAFQHGQRVAEAASVLQLPTEHAEAFGHRPAKIAVVGRTDIEYAAFGIGGNRERTARAIEEGYHTGFRQLPPKGGGKAVPKAVPQSKPPVIKRAAMKSAPKPAPVAPPKPTREEAIQRAASYGVQLTPGLAREVTQEEIEAVTRQLAKMPAEAHAMIGRRGGNLQVFAGQGISDHPDNSSLKGVTPRGYPAGGRTWDNVPGAGGVPGRLRTYVVANALNLRHGSVNLVIHEHAHTYDAAIAELTGTYASLEAEWLAVHNGVTWFKAYIASHPEESFAESFAAYYESEAIRVKLPQPVQDYFAKRFPV